LAGGVSDNDKPLRSADLWDFRTRTGKSLAADGTVLLSARTEEARRRGVKTQVCEPWRLSFLPSYAEPRDPRFPAMEASLPENRGTDAPVGAVIGIRFSRRLRVESLNSGQ
jgi:hypothetical protein